MAANMDTSSGWRGIEGYAASGGPVLARTVATVELHAFEWGDPGAPAVVCLHGVTAHGRRFEQLAQERWTERLHVLAPDLRGHGGSGWEPPWTFETYVDDLVETYGHLGAVDWVGHSFGGRLVLELAVRRPELVRRAVLLDPAIHVLPQIAGYLADVERADPVYDSVEAYVDSRTDAGGMDRARAIADMHL